MRIIKTHKKIKFLIESVKHTTLFFFKHWLTFCFKCDYKVNEYTANISTFIFKKGKSYNFQVGIKSIILEHKRKTKHNEYEI